MKSTDKLFKPMRLRFKDEWDRPVQWTVWRDVRKPALWVIRDHEGYTRTMDDVWATTAQRILLLADNYALTPLQQIN
jgi:hypothetical protein